MSFSFAIDIATKRHNLLPLSFLPRLHFSLQSYFTGKLQFHMWHFTSDVRLIWLALYVANSKAKTQKQWWCSMAPVDEVGQWTEILNMIDLVPVLARTWWDQPLPSDRQQDWNGDHTPLCYLLSHQRLVLLRHNQAVITYFWIYWRKEFKQWCLRNNHICQNCFNSDYRH